MSLAIRNLTKARPPRLRYAVIASQVLGDSVKSEVSLTFVSESRSRTLNRVYRDKDKSTNILTFPFAPGEGEILICLSTAQAEAKQADVSFTEYLEHLFIHGLLHLKGYTHGSRMETLEQRIIKFFTRYGQNHCYRTGRRHRISKSRRL